MMISAKVKASLMAAFLFFVVSSPFTYQLVNKVLGGVAVGGCPTNYGLMVHSVVYGLITYGLMGGF